ncbi:MAG: DUF1501 domain-containing protein [Planctomycetales bacterium]
MEPLSRLFTSGFPMTRRSALLCAAGWGLSFAVPGLQGKEVAQPGPERLKSLITLWMGGGPSQLETWDPHPGSKISGPTQVINTSISGVQIGADYPRIAASLSQLSVIRSLVSKEGDHERGSYFLKTGYRPDPTVKHPALGAVLNHQLPNPKLEIPPFIVIGDGNVDARGGYLGDEYDPFAVYDPRQNVTNLKMPVAQARTDRRLAGLAVVEAAFRQGREQEVRETMHRETLDKALKMMNSAQLRAFRIEEEPQSVRAAYGETRFGSGCLAARRLVEQGVRAVEVTLAGWDGHANNFEMHKARAGELDPALAELIKDLRDRDLWDSTVVICLGEFGRTPHINKLDGRDHWPQGFSCLLGGGGLQAGQVIGSTDPEGRAVPPTDPVEVKDLSATLLNALGVDYAKELTTPIGRPLKLSEGTPLARLWPHKSSSGRS